MNICQWPVPKGMETYLKPGKIIDSDSPVVNEVVLSLVKGVKTQAEAIRLIFHYCRDDIKYGRIGLYTKASDIIRKRTGNCTNKSVVFVAMLRAINIPARLHYFSITKEGIKHLLSPFTVLFTPAVVPLNAKADVYFKGRWITLETELDLELYRGLLKQKLIKPLDTSWDGNDSTHLFNEYNVADLGTGLSPEPFLDPFFAGLNWLEKIMMPFAWWTSNLVLEKHRRMGQL